MRILCGIVHEIEDKQMTLQVNNQRRSQVSASRFPQKMSLWMIDGCIRAKNTNSVSYGQVEKKQLERDPRDLRDQQIDPEASGALPPGS